MKSLEIGKAICNILLADEEVNTILGNKIFPLIANNSTTFPFAVYRRASVDITGTKDLYNLEEVAAVEIAIAAETYPESIEAVKKIHDALINKKGMFEGIDIKEIKIGDALEEYIDDAYVQTLKVTIKIK